MGSSSSDMEPAPSLTAPRAARLYKLLTLLGDGPKTRRAMLVRLKLDQRGFYRDMETLRAFGIDVVVRPDSKYVLTNGLDNALEKLPFPDPGLNVHEVMQLVSGNTAAHRKLRQRVNTFLNRQTGNASAKKTTGGDNSKKSRSK